MQPSPCQPAAVPGIVLLWTSRPRCYGSHGKIPAPEHSEIGMENHLRVCREASYYYKSKGECPASPSWTGQSLPLILGPSYSQQCLSVCSWAQRKQSPLAWKAWSPLWQGVLFWGGKGQNKNKTTFIQLLVTQAAVSNLPQPSPLHRLLTSGCGYS